MNYDFDVLIVGGGLVGSSLALALRGSPLRIAVIESVPEQARLASSAGERALALAYGSTQILDQVGVWRGAEPKAAPIRHIHVSDRGQFGKLRMDAKQEGVPALGYVVTARTLEEEAAAKLRQSGITQICPASVIGLKAGGGAVHVSLKAGNDSSNRIYLLFCKSKIFLTFRFEKQENDLLLSENQVECNQDHNLYPHAYKKQVLTPTILDY